MPVPPTLRDSSGNEYEPPVISASKTLESRYSFFFLCMALGILWVYGFVLSSILFLWLCTNCDVTVVDPGSQAVPATSEESDVFVCDPSQETPAAESEAVSVLPDSGARFERRQHYRPAVGLEPSTIHNEWEKGMCIWFVFFHTLILVVLLLDVICHSPVRRGGFLHLLVVRQGFVFCLAGLESVPSGSPVIMSAAQCVMFARCAARSERNEAMKETKTLAKRKLLSATLFICCSMNCFVCIFRLVCPFTAVCFRV